MVALTATIAWFTFRLAHTARIQFRQQTTDTAETLRLTREANEAAARDRAIELEVLQKQANDAVMALYLAQRARVGASHVRIGNIGPNRALIGEVGLRNWAGKPARPEQVSMDLHVGPLPQTPSYNNWHPYDFVLVAGAGRKTYKQDLTRPLTDAEWLDIEAGKFELFFYGRATYQTMGNNVHTGFCSRYDHVTKEFQRTYAPAYNEET